MVILVAMKNWLGMNIEEKMISQKSGGSVQMQTTHMNENDS